MKTITFIFAIALLFSSCRRDVKEEGIHLGEYDEKEESVSMPNEDLMRGDTVTATVNKVIVDSIDMQNKIVVDSTKMGE